LLLLIKPPYPHFQINSLFIIFDDSNAQALMQNERASNIAGGSPE
jgi:hypothetical protein